MDPPSKERKLENDFDMHLRSLSAFFGIDFYCAFLMCSMSNHIFFFSYPLTEVFNFTY